MPKYRAQVPYTDDLGREQQVPISVDARSGDPDELARAAEDEWEKLHPDKAGLLPEDLEWEAVPAEEE